MRLEIALIDHPEAQLVGQLQDPGVRRVVAGPDGVHSSLLHCDQVSSCEVFVKDPAEQRMCLVPVHPPEDHLDAVDGQYLAGDLDRTETDAERHCFRG